MHSEVRLGNISRQTLQMMLFWTAREITEPGGGNSPFTGPIGMNLPLPRGGTSLSCFTWWEVAAVKPCCSQVCVSRSSASFFCLSFCCLVCSMCKLLTPVQFKAWNLFSCSLGHAQQNENVFNISWLLQGSFHLSLGKFCLLTVIASPGCLFSR